MLRVYVKMIIGRGEVGGGVVNDIFGGPYHPLALGGGRGFSRRKCGGFTSHNPKCLRTCPPLEDFFYDVLILDEGDDAHLPVASFDRLRTGLGQVIEQSGKQRLTQRPLAFFLE